MYSVPGQFRATRTDGTSASQITTRMGVGSRPAHGLLTWGQFEISDERVHLGPQVDEVARLREPIDEHRVRELPSGPTGTFEKKLRFATMSRRPIPCRPSRRRKVSRQPGTFVTPYIRKLLGALQQPPMVSCRPHVSATIVNIGRATSE